MSNMFNSEIITIYTDGAARGNPGRGGFASIIVFGKEKVLEVGGKSEYTTNNKMELQGAIRGLSLAYSENNFGIKKMQVYTDSKYVLQGITEWIHGWKKNNWKTSAKKEVLNQDLWRTLDDLVSTIKSGGYDIAWTYVKGHSDNVFNARADEIATTCADDTALIDGEEKYFFNDVFVNWRQ